MSHGKMGVTRTPILVLLFTFALVYTYAASGLSLQFQRDGISLSAGGETSQGTIPLPSSSSSSDVSDAVVAKVAQSLSNVLGDNDELVVLPATGSTGVTVSATITLDGGDPSSTNWKQTVSDDIGQYFTDIYTLTQPIENAQVYFLQNGQLVAGAEVGRQVYKQLTDTTGTGSGGFVQSLAAQPVRTNQGAMDSWVQFNEDTP